MTGNMTTWHRAEKLDADTVVDTHIEVPDRGAELIVTRAQLERLLHEAGYAPKAAP